MTFHRLWALALFVVLAFSPQISSAIEQFPVRVVVIATYEIGEDSGDYPGEFQAWVEKVPLDEKIAFPQGYRGLRYNREKQILGIVTGGGPTHSAASIMALGMDPRFDLSKAYWVLAGIAGVNPNQGTIGSAAWAEWVVDLDFKYQIDQSEVPAGWTTGILPIGKSKPFAQPRPTETGGTMAYHLNPKLVDWAYRLTANVKLDDTPALQAARAGYPGQPNAMKPPHVLKGDEISAATWWLGNGMNAFAEEWMRYWTDGKGVSVMSAMEDSGVLQAMKFLDNAKRADFQRVLILRTASNFTVPRKGQRPDEMLAEENSGGDAGNLAAYLPSLDAAYRVASPVVLEIASKWDRYEGHIPGEVQ